MEKLSCALKALGDPLRLRILDLLPDSGQCEAVYNVSELALELGIPQPTVSHHLRILKDAGIVRSRKLHRDVYYWIDRETVHGHAARLFREVVQKQPAEHAMP